VFIVDFAPRTVVPDFVIAPIRSDVSVKVSNDKGQDDVPVDVVDWFP
jgi:hypothetical protein